jgi:small subunit ribosomal protein S2
LEANRLGIPVIAMVDTNTDPSLIKYPIASNDDAIKAISLITSYIKEAVIEGKANRAAKIEQPDVPKKPEKVAVKEEIK